MYHVPYRIKKNRLISIQISFFVSDENIRYCTRIRIPGLRFCILKPTPLKSAPVATLLDSDNYLFTNITL